MAIQDEMYKLIVDELNNTSLSTDRAEASSLVNQYIAQIKIICNSKQNANN